MFICPKCKSAILDHRCPACDFAVIFRNGIPVFFSDSIISKKYKEIGAFYDNLYSKIEDTWNKIASRGPEFIDFISKMVMADIPERYLDIGCGEGYLLAAVNAKEKYGIDVSQKALEVAATKSHLNPCIGFAEEMPFPDDYFDAISSIGVMTHFIDDLNATKEINRILKVGGRYILGIYLKPTFSLRCYINVRKMISEMKNPINLVHLFNNKVMQKIKRKKDVNSIAKQPIERMYLKKELLAILKSSGFILVEEITKSNKPEAPLPGYHFRVYILTKEL